MKVQLKILPFFCASCFRLYEAPTRIVKVTSAIKIVVSENSGTCDVAVGDDEDGVEEVVVGKLLVKSFILNAASRLK